MKHFIDINVIKFKIVIVKGKLIIRNHINRSLERKVEYLTKELSLLEEERIIDKVRED